MNLQTSNKNQISASEKEVIRELEKILDELVLEMIKIDYQNLTLTNGDDGE